MAFVFRQQKRSESLHLRKEQIPGPGSYNFDQNKQSKLPKAFIPFGSMEQKLKVFNQNKNTETPGVGTYNIDIKSNGQKIIVSSQTEDIKILEISRPHPVFKSSTLRFQGENEESPGPGEYDISQVLNRNKIYSLGNNNKSKVIQHLINLNKYQSIPSIPSNIHAYGYNDALQLNEPPVQVFKGQKGDIVGPGQYQAKVDVVKPRGISWTQPKTKKIQQVKPNTNLGPGSYQIKTMQPLYTYKPSPQFASKTLRSMDQRKGAIINNPQQNKQNNMIKQSRISQNPAESRMLSQKAPPSTQIGDDSDDSSDYEYIEDTTPGPGSYNVESRVKKYPANKTKNTFGVISKRFTKKEPQTGNIGPGQYHQDIAPRKFKCKTIKKQTNDQRFPGLMNVKKAVQPGPGAYEPRNTMQDKLIYKIQRGYRGQFGSTQARGKQAQIDQEPGPGSYDPKHLQDQKNGLYVFKSSSKRKGIQQINENPAPGAYQIFHNDIATRVIKQQQEDPDLIIKKPGFGVGQKRFKEEKIIKQQDYQDDDIIKQIQEKYRQQKKRKNLKPNSIFKSKQARFKDQRKDIPGPGSYYDGQQDHWNKRTYNILFADI